MISFFDDTAHICNVIEVFAATSKEGETVEYNDRGYYELAYKIDGSSYQIYDDKTLRLLPNSLYFIPKNKINSVNVDVSGTVIDIIFDFYNYNTSESLEPEILPLPQSNSIGALYEKLLSVWQKRDTAYRNEANTLLLKIITEAIVIYRKSSLDSSYYEYLEPILELIENEYYRDISIGELMDISGISGVYIRKLFRKYTGVSPVEYINNVRLRHARELLTSTDEKIEDIAKKCGFDDPKYFARVFKRTYGMTPREASHVTIG